MRYTQDQKETALRRMMPPTNQAVPEISEKMGIPVATLYLWRRKAQEEGFVSPGDGKAPDAWSSAEKFRMVVDTMGLAEVELSEYCRKRGVYPEQIESWREVCEVANTTRTDQMRMQKKQEKGLHDQIKALKRELNRKDKALAETAALLALRKKISAIWGEDEEV